MVNHAMSVTGLQRFQPVPPGAGAGHLMDDYVVYILFSAVVGKFYVGLTRDGARRLSEHRCGKSRWTSQVKDWKRVWNSTHMPLREARALEKKIKARGAGRFLADHESKA